MGALSQKTLRLLVDETKLHDRMAVMVVGVAWQNRCLPLVWRAYKADSAAVYAAEGQVTLIGELLVLVDRGIGCYPTCAAR